jgi:TPR repeat protein
MESKINSNYNRGLALEEQSKYNLAIQKYVLASKQGSAEAEFRLGQLHDKDGPSPNMQVSLHWYEQSAKKKLSSGFVYIGSNICQWSLCKKKY